MLDIDGTLCEIAERPLDATIPPCAAASLRRLNDSRRGSVNVAFVTGRSVADAQRMLGVERVLIYGSHGAERLSPAGNLSGPAGWESEGRPALHEAAGRLESLAEEFEGSVLEDKHYSLSLHYRGMDAARIPEFTQRARELARRWSLGVVEGKCVLNLLPPNAANKGDAVREIVRATGSDDPAASILFAGDDATDEDAFAALRDLPNAVTIHVGDSSSESDAKFSLRNPAEVHELLELLVETRA